MLIRLLAKSGNAEHRSARTEAIFTPSNARRYVKIEFVNQPDKQAYNTRLQQNHPNSPLFKVVCW